jgi:hypothetical protein
MKKMKKMKVNQLLKNSKITLLFFLVISVSSCIHNEFEEPPTNVIPVGRVYTLQDLYAIYDSVYFAEETESATYKFTEDCSVYAVISMDDKSGNLYKSAYMQDGIRGINLHLLSSGGLYEGDSVQIFLKDLVLGKYSGMLQLDSVDTDKNVVKVATLRDIEPEVVTISDLITYDGILGRPYIGRIVKIDNVQFQDKELGKTYADATNLITENRALENEYGDTIVVRTSGYASFADQKIPEGRGSIIALAGFYNGDWQLLIRHVGEVNFNQRRFGDYDTVLFAGFDGIDNGIAVSLTDWENYQQIGSISWMGSNNGESATVRIAGNGEANTTWLITPQVAINGAKLKFETRGGLLTGATLKAYISNDYDGQGNAENATWTELSANIGTGSVNSFGDLTESGTIDLASYNGQAYIAFKYVTEAGQNGQFYVDEILIFNE